MSAAPPRILKRSSAETTPAVGSAEELLAAARQRCRELLASAEEEAASVRARAAAEALQARLAAVEEGRAEGLGRAAAHLALAGEVREARLAELDAVVVEVALEIARQLVGRELETSPGAVLGVARRALRAAAGCGEIRLRVAPSDLAAIRGAEGELRALAEGCALGIVEDGSLAPGEVVVEAAGGRIDARIDAQLDAFRRALRAEAR